MERQFSASLDTVCAEVSKELLDTTQPLLDLIYFPFTTWTGSIRDKINELLLRQGGQVMDACLSNVLLSGDEHPLPSLLGLLAGARGAADALGDPAVGAWRLLVASNLPPSVISAPGPGASVRAGRPADEEDCDQGARLTFRMRH